MRSPGEEDLGVEHALHRQVARVFRLSGDLGPGIHASYGLTDYTSHTPSIYQKAKGSLPQSVG